MKVYRMFPRTPSDGEYLEGVAIFAARRCRTTKTHDELWEEVWNYTESKRATFLHQVVNQDWAADILEMQHLVFDLEGIPVWLVVELLRHRLLAREFSLEQLSQRAIQPGQLEVVSTGNTTLDDLTRVYLSAVEGIRQEESVPPEDVRSAYPQGVLVNLCIAGNLRAFHHFFFMRSSPLFGGKGGAHPLFMEMADQMQALAREVYPITMDTILEA